VLARKEVSISPLFPAEDREIAAEVVRSHGGNSQPKERGLEDHGECCRVFISK